jgi:glycerol-3-phosphate dehydrogenase (NAD(P)+)
LVRGRDQEKSDKNRVKQIFLDYIYTLYYTYIIMYNNTYKIAVLGDGGWGTTLSILLAKKGFSVILWSAFAKNAESIKANNENVKFLPGFKLPGTIDVTTDMKQAGSCADVIVVAIPSKFLRKAIIMLKGLDLKLKLLVSVIKGIENDTLKMPSEIIKDELGVSGMAVLSGPTIAVEIAKGLPASCVVACDDQSTAIKVQSLFMTDRFRVYTSKDIIGVELGGALKNIIAIASGISDGLGLGSNAKAALFTRGIVEMKRLGVYMGADPETFNGLSGMGDLVTTCISPYSRNRRIGDDIARGGKLSEILDKMEMVAEGVETARSVYILSNKIGIEMPIAEQVYRVLFEDKNPHTAVADLMLRNSKPE